MKAIAFLAGAYMATFAASGVFFFKFYRESKDRFFLFFGLACWLIALERIVLLSYDDAFQSIIVSLDEAHSWVYISRLCAFLLILYAVIDKNRKSQI